MALTKLSTGKTIEVAFSDRRGEAISEASVVLMRDGTDLEAELARRGKLPNNLVLTLSRTPFGDVQVTAERVS